MHDELIVLRDVIDKLARIGLDYMLTGSWALAYYAEPRMTRDIDLVVAMQTKDAESLIEVLQTDYYVPVEAAKRAIANETIFNVINNRFIVKVDFIIRKNSEYRQVEFERRRQAQLEDIAIWIVSKEDLILSKLIWASDSHSEFQLRDVKKLLESGYDAGYLAEWVDRLGLRGLLNECLNE